MAIKQSSYVFVSVMVLFFLFLVVCAGFTKDNPKKQLRECLEQCERVQQQEHLLSMCRRQCQAKFGQEAENKEEEENNPYIFHEKHFITLVNTDLGRVTILPKFTDRSDKLRNVDNFRISVLEASPMTFGRPMHVDADSLLVVVKGRGSVHMVTTKRQSFNVEFGDIFMVPSGVTFYTTNRDDKEKLIFVDLIVPVSITGHFQTFARVGGDEPESLFSAFSWKVLEAAFKINKEKLEKIFNQTERGVVKASKEQIEAMIPNCESTECSFNLLTKTPTQCNHLGSLFEAIGHDYKPLKDLNIVVSFTNITKGAMIAPYYNSRATKIAIVVEGEGWVEMGSPHGEGGMIEVEGMRDEGRRYDGRVSARLRQGTVFVVPAGHPLVVFAPENQGVKMLCFDVNAKDNIRIPLAGKNNIVSLMDKGAKELTFNVAASDVDSVFGNTDDEFFLLGPNKPHNSISLLVLE